MRDLMDRFSILGSRALPDRQLANQNWTKNRSTRATAEDGYCLNGTREWPVFEAQELGMIARAGTQMQGEDVDITEMRGTVIQGAEVAAGVNVDKSLSEIWEQLFFDIISMASNFKAVNKPPYLSIPRCIREYSSTEQLF